MSKVKLGDVCNTCLGKMLDAKKNKGEYHPYLANVDVRWGTFALENLSHMKFESNEHERYGIKQGDLIICEGGEPGRCAVWEETIPNMKIQKALHRVRPLDCLNVYYLYYWFLLSSKQNLLQRNFIQTTIKHLTGEQLKELEIDIPPIKTQENIVGVLHTIDKKIQLNNKINAKLEEMAKTIYDYWFTQFDFPNAEGKPYRSSGGEMEYNEELKREIPKGWEVSSIQNILGKIPNSNKIKSNEYAHSGLVPIIDQSSNFIVAYTSDKNATLDFHKGAVVFGDHTRVVKYIGFSFARGADGTQVLISNQPEISELLLYFIVKNIDLSNYGYARHFKFLKETSIIIPQETITKQFDQIIYPFFNVITKNIFETQELTALRDWLLPMLMNGQATVE